MLEKSLEVLKKLTSNGYKAYIVGGFVRDYLMGKDTNDVDITTNATPKDIRDIFDNNNVTHEDYGCVSVIYKGVRFEITTFRREIKYLDNRKPLEFQYINSLEEDLKRRDFIMNTLCMDSDGNIIDFFNARCDIDNKIINTVGDSNYKFNQDVFRILRAIRFATQLDFKLSDEIKNAIKINKYLLKNLSYTRKKEELDKIFVSTNVNYGVSLLKELDLLDVLDISKLKNINNFGSLLGIWARIDEGKYSFSKIEKEQIENIKKLLELDLYDKYTLYNYGLYLSMIVAEIKDIDKKKITSIYNDLVIKTRKDICINGKDIIDILEIEPSFVINDILKDIEKKIIYNELDNSYEVLEKYVLDNYK